MASSKFVVLAGRQPVRGVVEVLQAAAEIREATTGQVLVVPQIRAAAAPQPVRPQSAETNRLARQQAEATRAAGRAVPEAELGFYRKYTERLLQRYVQMTMEAGRVSSLMGREVIGGKASSYRVHGFDDTVIFRLDVEKCLRKLDPKERGIIRRVAIQEYTQAEAAELLGISLRTVVNQYGRALDKLTRILLDTRLLEPLRVCQAAAVARGRADRAVTEEKSGGAVAHNFTSGW
jgi:RNA polymerase sigma factor (sigma-70 family)